MTSKSEVVYCCPQVTSLPSPKDILRIKILLKQSFITYHFGCPFDEMNIQNPNYCFLSSSVSLSKQELPRDDKTLRKLTGISDGHKDGQTK